MPNRRTLARWTLWFLLLLPLAQVGGPLAWACSIQAHCAAMGGGCGGAGQPCGSACGHATSTERSCCNRAAKATGGEVGCACRPQAPTDHSGLLLLLAPELPAHNGSAAPRLHLPDELIVPVQPLTEIAPRLVVLSSYGSRGPPRVANASVSFAG